MDYGLLAIAWPTTYGLWDHWLSLGLWTTSYWLLLLLGLWTMSYWLLLGLRPMDYELLAIARPMALIELL